MGNRFVAKACEILAANRGLTDLAEFWRKIGCSHIELATERQHLEGASVLQEILGIAKREFAFRIAFKKLAEEMPDVEPATVERIARWQSNRPKPLRAFVLRDIPKNLFWECSLRPTKGWKLSRIDASDVKVLTEKHGLPLYRSWPKSRRAA